MALNQFYVAGFEPFSENIYALRTGMSLHPQTNEYITLFEYALGAARTNCHLYVEP
jgi:hypothetical protein